MDKKRITVLFLFVAFLIVPICVYAAKSADETQLCLACHGDRALTKKLMNKEILSLYVNSSDFRQSVHAKGGCTGCHSDISMDNHPVVKKIKSKKDYSLSKSKQCTVCHTDAELRKRLPIHSSLAAKGTCVECHGFHSIKSSAVQKTGVPENQYCMTCHSRQLVMKMKSGETLSVLVNESALRKSVHAKLKCTECHSGFSMTQHPMRTHDSKRTYSLQISKNCWKCHEKASQDYESSVHLDMLKRGNSKAPSCTDCHGDHAVVSTKKYRDIGITSCNKCHSDMNSSYEASMHGKAWKKGDEKAPTCASCHSAHNVESTLTTKIKEGCLKCHKEAAKAHTSWLKNPPLTSSSFAEAHFDVVSCVACHSPGAARAIYLSINDRKTGEPLPEEEILKILETDSEGLMQKIDTNADGSIDAKEIWDLFVLLYKKGTTTVFMGKMDVTKATEAHLIGGKAEATRDCEKCHHPNAEFFKDIFLVMKKADGNTRLLQAKQDVLNSIYTIIPARKFYALGSTSITLFDIVFVVALIGGIAVPIAHITFRVITSPLRSLRRMGKGGKK
ncbi:MAG: cytochrome c family protein [Nitrospirae bacterium]|jgi:TusA-related sulfurtransferase|nr:cytochrome c family protein [Nitrospirota bacterium]